MMATVHDQSSISIEDLVDSEHEHPRVEGAWPSLIDEIVLHPKAGYLRGYRRRSVAVRYMAPGRQLFYQGCGSKAGVADDADVRRMKASQGISIGIDLDDTRLAQEFAAERREDVQGSAE